MIYFLQGQSGTGKSVLGKKLHKFLKTEKRNWRKDVFHIDEIEIRNLTDNTDYSFIGINNINKQIELITEYLHNNGCDVVVSALSPYRTAREEFKDRFAIGDFQEIYTHTNEKQPDSPLQIEDYEAPEINFIDIDTTKDSIDTSFSKLINHLHKLNKL